jgi:kelch-like protein 1/4/5
MPPRKRSRADPAPSCGDASGAAHIVLSGGFTLPPRIVDKFRSGKFWDVELHAAGGETFRAHALCLTAGSEYFEALLAGSDWSDATGPIQLLEVPAHALSACLEFIYVGEATVPSEASLLPLLEAAAYLQMPQLVAAATAAMAKRLSPTTALQVWEVADRQGLSALAEAAATSAARHFATVVSSEAWLSAPVQCVRDLLASDRLVVDSESRVYEAAVAWLRARSPPIGEDDAAALLARVRFTLLPRDFYMETVRAEPLLKTPAGAQTLIDSLATSAFGGSTRRRMGFEQLYALGGRSDNLIPLDSLQRYDPATNTWESVAPMSTVRSYHAAAVLDGKLYALGGKADGSTFLSTMERYDPATNTWESVAPMSTSRCGHAAAVLDGKLYALGGKADGSAYLSTMERYDPATNTWESMQIVSAKLVFFSCSSM